MKNRVFFKLFILVLILLFVNTIYGQKNYLPGYVINFKGDTINGLINYRNWDTNPQKIDFKKHVDGEINYINPAKIKEFGVVAEIYKSGIVEVDESNNDLTSLTYSKEFKYRVDTAFLQTLVQGEKSLYRYKDLKGKEHFFIGQATGFELLQYKEYYKSVNGVKNIATNNKFIGQLCYYLRDCPEIATLTAHIKYTESSLTNLFQEYNNCTSKEARFVIKKKKASNDFGILAGLSVTKLTFKGKNNDDLVEAEYSLSKNFSFGLFFDLILQSRLQNRWSIYNELLLTTFKTGDQYTKESQIENGYTKNDISLEYSYLKVNNTLRYRYFTGTNMSIFFNAGISNGFVVNDTNHKIITKVLTSPPATYVEDGKALDDTKYEMGITAGVGSSFQKISFEIRYESSTGISSYVDLKSPVKRIYFLFGYRF